MKKHKKTWKNMHRAQKLTTSTQKTRLAPTKGTKTDDFDAKTRLIFMIYLMYWI